MWVAALATGAALLLALLLRMRGQDPGPLFGVYTQPGRWYYLKYAVFACIYYFRKYANAGRAAHAGGRVGQGVRAQVDPATMERAQPFSDHPKAFDAVFFTSADTGAGAEGTYVMMGCERRPLGMCNGLFYIALPGKGLLCSKKLPDTVLFGAEPGQFAAEGIRITPEEPMKTWRLQYQGPMWYQKDPSEVVEVSFEGVWKAGSDYFDFDSDLHPPAVIRSIAREPWSRQYFEGLKTAHQSHYEQFGSLSGTVALGGVGGERRSLRLASFRDHSFGARRDWSLMHRYAFHQFFLADGHRVSVGVVCQPSTATRIEMGVVALPDGRVLPVRWADLQLWRHGEAGAAPRDYAFRFQAGDRVYNVQVVVEHSATHYVSAEWEARMEERFCRFSVDGVPGRGASEFHYRHRGGRPPAPGDPDWFRNMHHT